MAHKLEKLSPLPFSITTAKSLHKSPTVSICEHLNEILYVTKPSVVTGVYFLYFLGVYSHCLLLQPSC